MEEFQTAQQSGQASVDPRVQFLRRELAEHVKTFKTKGNRTRAATFTLRGATILLGLATTVILGVKQ